MKTLPAIMIVALLGGCASQVDRESKLLTMAAGEAQQITDSTERLTRQLNFASLQASRGRKDESRQSLAYAQQTLKDAKPGALKPQIRIAGWVSISELSRQDDDKATAQTACNQAVAVLNSLDPISQRPEFVIGVAKEVEALQGKPAAAKVLVSSVEWIKHIDGNLMQRVALIEVTRQIFNYDDYDGGLVALRTDPDAAWRSDTLARFADENRRDESSVPGVILHTPDSFIDPSELEPGKNYGHSLTSQPFSKPVDFQSVFQQSKGQN